MAPAQRHDTETPRLSPVQMAIVEDPMKDNGGIMVPADIIIKTNAIHEAARDAVARGLSPIMIGALTSATNNFGRSYRPRPDGSVYSGMVGIQSSTATADQQGDISYTHLDYRRDDTTWHDTALQTVRSDEIRVNEHREGEEQHTVTVGAGITFSQINHVLGEAFGDDEHYEYFVPIDLTTMDTAHSGAVFATGAQGPSRIRLNEITKSVTMTDGKKLIRLTHPDDIKEHQGLWGMTGGVVEMELRVLRRPKHRFGFFVPLMSGSEGTWTDQAAAVMELLGDATDVTFENGFILSKWKAGYVDGIEVITRESLDLVTSGQFPAGQSAIQAKKILNAMSRKGKNNSFDPVSNFGLYITGNSKFAELDAFLDGEDNPLFKLIAQADSHERFLYGDGIIALVADAGELEKMRLLREAIPDIARQHAKFREDGQAKPISDSTDVNSHVNNSSASSMTPGSLREKYHTILQPYAMYESRIRRLSENAKKVDVDITMSRYGHLNPRSINPHTRVTVKGPEGSVYLQVYQQVVRRCREELFETLRDLSVLDPDIIVEGGEKGKMTGESYFFMDEEERMHVAHVLAEADPQWQPHLRGEWGRLVDHIRRNSDTTSGVEDSYPEMTETLSEAA